MQPSSAAAVELPIGARNASHTIPRNQNGEDEYPPFRTAAPRRCEEAAALAMPLGLNLTTIGCRSTAFAVVMLSTRQTGSACARPTRVPQKGGGAARNTGCPLARARRLRKSASSASSAQNSEQKCCPADVRQNST